MMSALEQVFGLFKIVGMTAVLAIVLTGASPAGFARCLLKTWVEAAKNKAFDFRDMRIHERSVFRKIKLFVAYTRRDICKQTEVHLT